MKIKYAVCGLLVSLFSGFAFHVSANSSGITGFSGKQGSTCGSCHSSGGADYRSSLSFEGEVDAEPGELLQLALTVSFTPPSSVPNPMAGINIATSDGSLVAGEGLQASNSELTHTFASLTTISNNAKRWTFNWRAPSDEGQSTIFACAQLVNRNFTTTGDDSNTACISQTITIADANEPPPPPPDPDPEPTNDVFGDLDHDGKADLSIWRPSTQTFYARPSQSSELILAEVMGNNEFGVPLTGDVDGNGQQDAIVWRDDGIWEIILDSGQSQTFTLGQSGDYPFLADVDGDGADDPIVRRPSEGNWYYLLSSRGHASGNLTFGSLETDIPTLGDYDADGRVDFSIWRNGTWFIRQSSNKKIISITLGSQEADIPVPADYDGDGVTDTAIWRPSNGFWYINLSSTNIRRDVQFGSQSSDIPIPADYDGDGSADLALRRPSSGLFIYKSSINQNTVVKAFGGQETDVPVLGAFRGKQTLIKVPEPQLPATRGDADADDRADYVIWRPSNRTFYARSTDTGSTVINSQVGTIDTGIPLFGDFDGDGENDHGVYQPESGIWTINLFSGQERTYTLGGASDYPFWGDIDGDGVDDPIVREPDTGSWSFLLSSVDYQERSLAFGSVDTDTPVLGDYDGDGLLDFSVWRAGTWYLRYSSDKKTRAIGLGRQAQDIPVPADYDGDGKTDVAIWRPSNGVWYVIQSSTGQRRDSQFGSQSTDIPIPADYDGDGKADLALRRPSTGQFIYRSSVDDSVVVSTFGQQSTDIPLLGAFKSKKTLFNEPTDPTNYYTENVSEQVIQGRCIACHVSDGAAASSGLIFERSDQPNYIESNMATIASFLSQPGVDGEYLLSKAQGLLGHGGGQQLVAGSSLYSALAEYLGIITGEDLSFATDSFWNGFSFLDNRKTLRKASIILAGRLPTEDEYQSVSDDSDESLRSALLGLMEGDGFHSFLTTGANDKLHTQKYLNAYPQFLNDDVYIVERAKRQYQANVDGKGDEFYSQQTKPAEIAYARSATELVAHVVMNDLPYSEVITADYTMMNPMLNAFYRGDAEFDDVTDINEFRPGKLNGFMLRKDTIEEYDMLLGHNIIQEGSIIEWPHAGILNDPAFLERYPSTATNRNRARSRWVQYLFLDFDIEKSAARTNDPEALADRDNPTLKNPNCTSCHEALDPVAGAFQNYGDVGWYRDAWTGSDSLHDAYKWPEDGETLYQEGDTWYRDMRAPGFGNLVAPSNDNSVQWLAQQIVNDGRFTVSAVKFWWPAVMGLAVSNAPEDPSDTDFDIKSDIFVAQNSYIYGLAGQLRSHMNLKLTLVDMMMGPWFRADQATGDISETQAANLAGTGRLLSPELLDKKMKAVFGVSWREEYPDWNNYQRFSALNDEYRILYGGIDSVGVIKRADRMTSMMSKVALTQTTQTSCKVVVEDFQRAPDERYLFSELTPYDSPDAIGYKEFSVDNYSSEDSRPFSLRISGSAGDINLGINYLNDYADFEVLNVDANLGIDKIVIKAPSGQTIAEYEGDELQEIATGATECAGVQYWQDSTGEDYYIYGSCLLTFPLYFEEADDYTIDVYAYSVYQDEFGEHRPELEGEWDIPRMSVSATLAEGNNTDTINSVTTKRAIAALMNNAWGTSYDEAHAEVAVAYDLFETSRMTKFERSDWFHIDEDGAWCNNIDWSEFDSEPGVEDGYDAGNDPFYLMSAWRTVVAYVMSDYRFLYE
ncbi:choice-of-anchor V domain-containing protein [Glaciecola sp. KUL10]|uniref:choice-of-anchor V domain-containing protein n=1 Tax=Glaciecola sp. (strain KUL10) TaxID=2161813 RepID=UPI000D785130|nr:choice-of-anchor V domain-containing protein [Glaciecola sp. KUL10]GBL03620.1 glycoside hydrolase family 25 [Glaciecola sp. KUL10]